MSSDYSPRLSVEISLEHKELLDKYFGDYGRKREMVFVLLEDLFRLCEKHGSHKVIGALVERAISLQNICKLNLKESSNGNN